VHLNWGVSTHGRSSIASPGKVDRHGREECGGNAEDDGKGFTSRNCTWDIVSFCFSLFKS
jgi:hypothetical protein